MIGLRFFSPPVFRSCHKFKVIRTNAQRIFAKVIPLHPLRWLANYEVVRTYLLPVIRMIERAIAAARVQYITFPVPAMIGFVDECPKPLDDGHSMRPSVSFGNDRAVSFKALVVHQADATMRLFRRVRLSFATINLANLYYVFTRHRQMIPNGT